MTPLKIKKIYVAISVEDDGEEMVIDYFNPNCEMARIKLFMEFIEKLPSDLKKSIFLAEFSTKNILGTLGNKYNPKFTPDKYLKFLNEQSFELKHHKPNMHLLELYKEGVLQDWYDANSVEECIDEAILAAEASKKKINCPHLNYIFDPHNDRYECEKCGRLTKIYPSTSND